MKFSLEQLQKLSTFPAQYEAECIFPLSDISSVNGLLGLDTVNVQITIRRIDFETYHFFYQLRGRMELECVLTLEPVETIIDYDFDEIYGQIESEEIIKIDKQTIDIDRVVWSYLVSSIPIRVVHDKAEEILRERNIQFNEEIPDDDV